MKTVKASLVLALGLLLVAGASPAAAQTSGAITISGTVSTAYQLTSGGAATLAGNVGGSVASSGPDANIASAVNFGDVGPGNNSGMVCFTQPLLIRSTAAFAIRGQLTSASFNTADPSALQPNDVGVGLTGLGTTGPQATTAGVSFLPGLGTDPCAAAQDADGVASFARSLDDVSSAATKLMEGSQAVTLNGSFNSNNNAVTANLKMAIAPLAYTPGSFSATLTLTIAAP